MKNSVVIKNNFENVLGIVEDMNTEQLQQLAERARDERLKKNEQAITFLNDKTNKLESKINIIENENKEIKEDYTKLKDLTYVLATDDVKSSELKELIQKQAFKFTGNKSTIEYLLFYRKYISDIYKNLYDKFKVAKYSRIKIDDFDEAKIIVKGWFPRKFLINNIEKTYIKQIENKTLSKEKEIAFNTYLENKLNGGIK